MAGTKLKPERITTPIQLMAAWFTMLILLDAVLLAAAAKISEPPWAAACLVVLVVLITGAVILVVTLMLTKFRPHLQEGDYYARWLADQNTYALRRTQKVEAATTIKFTDGRMARRRRLASVEPDSVPATSRPNERTPVAVLGAPGASKLVASLRDAQFDAEIYEPLLLGEDKHDRNEAVWVGYRVPVSEAVRAIRIAIEHWPHLKYFELSNDGAVPPDEIHDQLFVGGATETAIEDGLEAWTVEEIRALDEDMADRAFRSAIRAKYTSKALLNDH